MPGKRLKAEEIANKLRQADVELARGSTRRRRSARRCLRSAVHSRRIYRAPTLMKGGPMRADPSLSHHAPPIDSRWREGAACAALGVSAARSGMGQPHHGP